MAPFLRYGGNYLISRELFCEAMDSIMFLHDYQNERNKLASKFGVDGYMIEPSCEAVLLKIIKEGFGNCGEMESIESFVYDMNFGRGKGNKIYVDSDGQERRIESAQELYDYLLTNVRGD